MRKLSSLLWVSLVYFSLFSCKKTEEKINLDSINPCTPIDFGPPGESIEIQVHTGIQYGTPVFSPFDADEFVYFKFDDGFVEFIKYNINSKTEIVLFDSNDLPDYLYISPYYRVDWGASGKIMIVLPKNSRTVVLRIDDDGNNPIEVCDENFWCQNVSFNNSGTEFLSLTSTSSKYIIFDINGVVIDSIDRHSHTDTLLLTPYFFNTSNFYDGYTFFSVMENGYWVPKGIAKLNNGELDVIADDINWNWFDFEIYQNTLYYILNDDGLYKRDLTTGISNKIISICNGRNIRWFDVSPISGEIIFEEAITIYEGGYDTQLNIVKINPNTYEEVRILSE